MNWESKIPLRLGDIKEAYHGVSGVVYVLDEYTVAKSPVSSSISHQEHDIERKILDRLGDHPRIVKVLAQIDQSEHRRFILMERQRCNLRQSLCSIESSEDRFTPEKLLKFTRHAAEGLHHVHQRGVRQVDIGLHNMLLDDDDNLKLCDFAGASIDGSVATICPSQHIEYPWYETYDDVPTQQSEIFVLGGALYEMSTFHKPYSTKTDFEVRTLYRANQFPYTDDLLLGPIMRKCWLCQYTNAGEIVDDVMDLEHQFAQAKRESRPFRSTYGPTIDPKEGLSVPTAYFILAVLVAVIFRPPR